MLLERLATPYGPQNPSPEPNPFGNHVDWSWIVTHIGLPILAVIVVSALLGLLFAWLLRSVVTLIRSVIRHFGYQPKHEVGRRPPNEIGEEGVIPDRDRPRRRAAHVERPTP